MAPYATRCPRCRHTQADLWRTEVTREESIRHLVCCACSFDWAITESVTVSVGRSHAPKLALVFSRGRDV
jgi:hypothetical protein